MHHVSLSVRTVRSFTEYGSLGDRAAGADAHASHGAMLQRALLPSRSRKMRDTAPGVRTWCSHMLVRMKKSSMKTAPKGRMPPMSTLNAGCMYHACSGTCLGILFVRTGSFVAKCVNPVRK